MGTTEASGTESRTERADFQATADPALNEAADRTSEIKLLTYEELYLLWERQQWQTQELDFSRDREDWHERIAEEERFQRMYGLSSFFIGEQKVAEELGPIMRAAPTEEQQNLPLHPDRRRGPPRALLRALLPRGRRARVRRALRDADRRPPSTSTRTSAASSTRC